VPVEIWVAKVAEHPNLVPGIFLQPVEQVGGLADPFECLEEVQAMSCDAEPFGHLALQLAIDARLRERFHSVDLVGEHLLIIDGQHP